MLAASTASDLMATTTDSDNRCSLKGAVDDKDTSKGETDPWSIFAAGKDALKSCQYEEAVDMFSAVLEHLYR